MEYLGIKHGAPWAWCVLYHADHGVQRMVMLEHQAAERAAVALHGVIVPLVPQGKPPETVPKHPF